jgi:leucyl-tRNA synthetase
MHEYNHKEIEEKWQKQWEKEGLNKTGDNPQKPKCYVLDEFPYPSGEGLHTGHTRIYTASDIYARMKRMQGFNVLHPSGWDAFGLPAEQFAIKHNVHPSQSVKKNTERYKAQMNRIGLSYDWEREINTTDPAFYKWTQWTFLKMLEKGLAFESFEPINWCPTCQTGLANEDLDGGNCERCSTPVEKKPMRQWVIRITKYADRLIDDLDILQDWPEPIKEAQRNWIGRSEGAEIEFPLSGITGQEDVKHNVTVFTTRPDTLFGATYLAISAELAKKWLDVGWQANVEVKEFIKKTIAEEKERSFDTPVTDKEGIATGIFATNPANQEKIPVWIANYVLSGYGTGAIMAVPAHDERDFEFAKKFALPVRMVICPNYPKPECPILDKPYTGGGHLVDSGKFNGTKSTEAGKAITEFVGGKIAKQYRLKDWVFSRQRYWGEPIPVVHCAKDGVVPVPENQLPVTLPDVESYAPSGTGESPLADIAQWVNTTCPKCGGPAKRETNTMPQWAGSSWYYLRFMDPQNAEALVGKDTEKYWSPVDVYVGGAEHVTRHLIYARFWHKFLFDIGVVSGIEPFAKRRGVGLVLGEGGVKMSKRLGNVINPDDIIDTFGADSLRIYEMFMGPFGQAIAWSTDNLVGARRFVERIWKLGNRDMKDLESRVSKELDTLYHQTIKKVGDDIEDFKFNTAISQLMILLNAMEKEDHISHDHLTGFLKLLAPFAPHITEEIWGALLETTSIHREAWPASDPEKIISESITIGIQVNGKVRGDIEIARSTSAEEVKQSALAKPEIQKWLDGKVPKNVIYVEGKILNIVV